MRRADGRDVFVMLTAELAEKLVILQRVERVDKLRALGSQFAIYHQREERDRRLWIAFAFEIGRRGKLA